MHKKLLKFSFSIVLVLILVLFSGCSNDNSNDTIENQEPYVYSAVDIVDDCLQINNYYKSNCTLKHKDNNEYEEPKKLCYDEANEKINEILSSVYRYWQKCENLYSMYLYHDSGSTTYGTYTYHFEKIDNGFDLTYTFMPNNSINRYDYKYIMTFSNQTFCVEYWQDSGYSNDNHYFIDIKNIPEGLFIQYYYKYYYQGVGEISSIMQYLYTDDENLYFNSNSIKEQGSTKYTNKNIALMDNFTLPNFEYIVIKNTD